MLTLGIETSCDETGIAFYDSENGLLSHTLHTQMKMHAEYGGVVPELASRDHIRRIVPLIKEALSQASRKLSDIDAIAYTQGPGLAGALLVGTSFAKGLAFSLGKPSIGIHHLEGHLLSPLLADPAPQFPFIALLVSGGHSQLMDVAGVGRYTLLGETLDDAAGEAFDKTAKLLGLGYPGGPALAKLATIGDGNKFKLPRPMINSDNLEMSFSGLKTAVLTLVNQCGGMESLDEQTKADIAIAFQKAIVDVLIAKSINALKKSGYRQLVIAGGVGANQELRTKLREQAAKIGADVFYPPLEFCTDNGAMIAFAGAKRIQEGLDFDSGNNFTVKPRWDLETLA